ncbi:MAG: hypothetical protein KAR21_03915, partial [Spirochaetales bacterium]|nr:hypothetical protein [Spirochaetales bacterium]
KEATTEIITQIKHNIERRPLTIPQNADKIEKTEITPSTEKEEIVTDETDSIEETTEKESETVPDIDPENFRHFTISAGFSPFLTTGKASNYFTYGLMPVQYTGYRFHTSYGYFSSGLFSSLNYFTAEGVLVSSENILISAGPEIRFGFTAYPFQDLFFRLSGGGTFFMMNTNNKGYISTVIPFASGGMGLTMNVTPWFGIVVSLNYSLYIEYSILISGFSPSGNISLRL